MGRYRVRVEVGYVVVLVVLMKMRVVGGPTKERGFDETRKLEDLAVEWTRDS